MSWLELREAASKLARNRLFLGAVAIIVFLWVGNWLTGFLPQSETLGRIFVDTPEIYTRERLVNDRFLQDAWLNRELERVANPGQQSFDDRRSTSAQVGSSAAAAGAADTAKKGEIQANDAPPGFSDRQKLLETLDYRDVVRNLTIENQLDDRHDLKGNSLYKLKFDAAVLPGTNTQASAEISIRLAGPSFLYTSDRKKDLRSVKDLGNEDDLRAWRKIYKKWVENLGSRLNQTQKELKQAYYNDEFAHNDYARLLSFLLTAYKVTVKDVPACPPALLIPHAQDNRPIRLTAKEHGDRKTCIRTLVTKAAIPARPVAFDPNFKPENVGLYPVGAPPARQGGEAESKEVVTALLDNWLNAYCATTTVRLVLGLAIPERSFVGHGFYEVPALRALVQLVFFNPYPKSIDGDVFTVKHRVAGIAAIDPARAQETHLRESYKQHEEFWRNLYETRRNPAQAEYSDFKPKLLPELPYHVSSPDLDEVLKDDVDLTGAFQEPFKGSGIYVAKVEVGLLNFARMARDHVQAFTYSVTPKESSDSVSFTLSTESIADGSLPLPGETAAGVKTRRETLSRSLERRNAVVGYAAFTRDGSAQFGWLISPRHTAINGQRHVQIQTPGQYPLSALISMPSWWSEVKLEITTSWVGRDGNPIGSPITVPHYVDIPTDFEPLEGVLLGIEQLGPELMESRLDPILLTACRPAFIVIPGRRLWRSTRVTLGYQTADSIAVLPNMKGIVARFVEVQNQESLSEAEDRRKGKGPEILRAVRVWTSQGSLTLPAPARIGIPDGCPREAENKGATTG